MAVPILGIMPSAAAIYSKASAKLNAESNLAFFVGERADIACEIRFAKAYQPVAHDPIRMFQPLLRADFNLGFQTFTAAEHRSANGRRELRGDQRLSAHYDEDAKLLRITAGL